MNDHPVSRMAPTPNGELHWGNLYNFGLTWALVRQGQGKLWLRFDDIDRDRCEERYADDTRTLLRYLGLDWDEEFSHQVAHLDEYRSFLKKTPYYVCRCSRQDVHARTGDYHYDGHCREKGFSFEVAKSAIRFLSPQGPRHDFILWRRENIPAYHLTSVCDDERMGINLIVRGEDLLESTQVQRELSRSIPGDPLGGVTFQHHPLILSQDGQKLSKSRGEGTLMTLIRSGRSAESIWSELGVLLQKPIRGPQDLVRKN